MDIAAFADEDFDEKEWINKIFKTSEAQENKDAFASSLVKKLQVYSQQVGVALEDASEKVLQSLPRVVRDTELLHQEALMLRDKMQAVKAEIAKAEQDTGQSMAALEQVDRVKAELQAARQALREADNWTILATDIEEKFEQADLNGTVTTLLSMQQSLRILAHVPDFEDKCLQLEGLKNRLEAKASPLIVQAFTSGDVEQSKKFVNIFTGIERLPELLKYHHKCQEKALLQRWRDIADLDTDESAVECFNRVYDALKASWTEQVKWCNQVFAPTPPLTILLPLFADLLIGLEPSLSACVGSCLALPDPLASLTDLRQVTKQAAATLQAAVESLAQTGDQPDPDMVLALAQAIHAPWVVAVQRYGELERPGMQSQLNSLGGEEVADRVQALGQTATRVVDLASNALARCSKLTELCGVAGLIESLEEYVKGYSVKFRAVLEELSQQKSEEENWTLFQLCLTLLQASGDLVSQVTEVQETIACNLRELNCKLEDCAGNSPFQQHDELLLTPDGRAKLKQLLADAQHEGLGCLEKLLSNCKQLCSDAQRTAAVVIFAPIAKHLLAVQTSEAWTKNMPDNLPYFSYTPQEYITEVGQYLMTLPQHLEPFLLRDNPGVGVALQAAGVGTQENKHAGAAELLLGSVAAATCQAFLDHALTIEHISPSGAKQLAGDIEYLGNVLEDLLDVTPSESLMQACQLLQASPETYPETSVGCAPRLVAAIRQMRNLPSTS